MNNQKQQQQQQQQPQKQVAASSTLSLLVNAADSQACAQRQPNNNNGVFNAPKVADAVLRAGLADSTQFLRGAQRQHQDRQEGAPPQPSQQSCSQGNQQVSQQMSQQVTHQLQQQFSQLSAERLALATAQVRQLAQLSNSDLVTLLQSGFLPGLLGAASAPQRTPTPVPATENTASSTTNGSAPTNAGQTGSDGGNKPSNNSNASATSGDFASGSSEKLDHSRIGIPVNNKNIDGLQRHQQLLLSAVLPQFPSAGRLGLSESQPRQEAQSVSSIAASSPLPSSVLNNVRSSFTGDVSATHHSAGSDTQGGDESQKTPGSVIVPCRARGMPMEHNFKTAYFVIPENVQHGEELICSYSACQNAGVKFRYCSHCKVPVAKRNFRKRHNHGDSEGDDKALQNGDLDEDQSTASTAAPEFHVPAERAETEMPAIPEQVAAVNNRNSQKPAQAVEKSESASAPRIQQNAIAPNSESGSNSSYSTCPKRKAISSDSDSTSIPSGDEPSKSIDERRQRWEALLDKRPSNKDGDLMSSWLMEVLIVSDPIQDPRNGFSGSSGLKSGKKNGNFSASRGGSGKTCSGLLTNGQSSKTRKMSASSDLSNSPGTSNAATSGKLKHDQSSSHDRNGERKGARKGARGLSNDSSGDTTEANDMDGSSNDSSSDGRETLNEKSRFSEMARSKKSDEKKSSRQSKANSGKGVAKKKRSLGDDREPKKISSEKKTSEAEGALSSSFAEWRDRKKQKKGAAL